MRSSCSSLDSSSGKHINIREATVLTQSDKLGPFYLAQRNTPIFGQIKLVVKLHIWPLIHVGTITFPG